MRLLGLAVLRVLARDVLRDADEVVAGIVALAKDGSGRDRLSTTPQERRGPPPVPGRIKR